MDATDSRKTELACNLKGRQSPVTSWIVRGTHPCIAFVVFCEGLPERDCPVLEVDVFPEERDVQTRIYHRCPVQNEHNNVSERQTYHSASPDSDLCPYQLTISKGLDSFRTSRRGMKIQYGVDAFGCALWQTFNKVIPTMLIAVSTKLTILSSHWNPRSEYTPDHKLS